MGREYSLEDALKLAIKAEKTAWIFMPAPLRLQKRADKKGF